MNATCETTGKNMTEETYFVFYGEHDSGSDGCGFMVREGLEVAKRTEERLWECGYRRIELKWGMDLLNG